jgi:hypothetical protein
MLHKEFMSVEQIPTEDDIQAHCRRLEAHRITLRHYLEQRAKIGALHVPPGNTHGIIDARYEIQHIKRTLHEWGSPVEDHPDDDDRALVQRLEDERLLRGNLVGYVQWFFRLFLMILFMLFVLAGGRQAHWSVWKIGLGLVLVGGLGFGSGPKCAELFMLLMDIFKKDGTSRQKTLATLGLSIIVVSMFLLMIVLT